MIAQDISFSFPSTVCVMGGGKTGRACIACIAAFMEDLHAAHARAACEQDTPAVSNTSYANPCAALTQLDFYPGNTTLDPKDIERFTRLGIGIYPEVQAPVRAYDLCITSPGISPQTAFYQAFAAASREMIGEPIARHHQKRHSNETHKHHNRACIHDFLCIRWSIDHARGKNCGIGE